MDSTRVWWDGSEVIFVRWTDRALVFSWCDATETAVQMPRGVVMRLLEKGVLHVEGAVPEWMVHAQRIRKQSLQIDPLPELVLAPQPAAAPPPPVARPVAQSEDDKRSKLSVVARLIRKLGGNPDRKSASAVS